MRKAGLFLALILTVAWLVAPYIWQVATSLKPTAELANVPPILPTRIDWSHYKVVLGSSDFRHFILNSFIVATLTSFLAFAAGSLTSFVTAHFRFKSKPLLLSLILAVSMFPPIAIVSPLFLMIKAVHLRDTYWALILPYSSFALPFMVWTLHNFFKKIPEEIMEAARLDGCSHWQLYSRIVLPLSRPAIFTTSILVFIFAWNEFVFALTFTATPKAQTIPVGIALFPGVYEIPWGDIAAATIVVTIPLIILVTVFERQIISGLTAGAVKT
ncbi:MAG: carbohydrate ABC transporter permease [Calditrichaeota bacterium]|nr:carbohydrate ABC transporter permease [Calditrichota bacterium]